MPGHRRGKQAERTDERERCSEAELARDYPEFELGAVPPLGGTRHDPVVVDSRLARRDSVVLEAGSHDESIRIWMPDLLRVSAAQTADICQG